MIETERLQLRPWRDADREPFWAMAQDPEVMRYLPAITRMECDGAIDRMKAVQAEHGYCFWALARKADSRFLGFCGLLPPRPPLSEIEIGWRLASDVWGQGYAREAAEAALSWAWLSLETPSIAARSRCRPTSAAGA